MNKGLELRGPSNYLLKLQELAEIREKKKHQADLLKEKMESIRKDLASKQGGQLWPFSILESISSLKSINRASYALNSR